MERITSITDRLRVGRAIFLVELLKILRLRSGWALLAGILILSVAILALPNHPFHQPGVFSLQSFAGLDQLLVTFLAGAALLVARRPQETAWWPCSSPARILLTGLGAWCSTALIVTVTVGLQAAGAALAGDLRTEGPLGIFLGPRYLQLLLLALSFALVVHAWAQLLAYTLQRAAALMTLLVLMFTGFLLSHLVEAHPAIELLLVFVPDLATLAPVGVSAHEVQGLPARALYALLHALFVWFLAAVLIDVQTRRGHGFDRLANASYHR